MLFRSGVHDVLSRVWDENPSLSAVWCGDSRLQCVVKNDDELKLCLALMEKRGWIDYFVVKRS